MSRKLSADDIFDIVEVDLWGNGYTLRQITKSISPKVDKAEKAIQDLPDDATDDAVAKAMITVVDLLLEPSNGEPAAAVLLGDLWKTDKLGLDWLTTFVERLGEEAEQRRRPTSLTPTEG